MIAYHGDPKIKAKILKQLRSHARADQIVKGQYWEDGKGCAVGCTIHSGNHLKYESRFGIPQILAYLEDRIFEGLPNVETKTWPVRFMSAIAPGADLSRVGGQFLHWLLTDSDINPGIDHPIVRDSVKRCAGVLFDMTNGKKVTERTAWNAKKRAQSAADSAKSAAMSAAESVALSAQSAAASAKSAAMSAAMSARSAADAANAAESAELSALCAADAADRAAQSVADRAAQSVADSATRTPYEEDKARRMAYVFMAEKMIALLKAASNNATRRPSSAP